MDRLRDDGPRAVDRHAARDRDALIDGSRNTIMFEHDSATPKAFLNLFATALETPDGTAENATFVES